MNCFNCSASQRSCDRTRHRCDTCAKYSELCQGYPRELQWLTGVTSRGKQKGRSISIDSSNTEWESITPTNHTFIFKQGRPQKKGRHQNRTSKQQWTSNSTSKIPQAIPESKQHVSHQVSAPLEFCLESGVAIQDDSKVDLFNFPNTAFDNIDTHNQQALPYNNNILSASPLLFTSSDFTWKETSDSTSDNGPLLPLLEALQQEYSPLLTFQPPFGSSELLAFCEQIHPFSPSRELTCGLYQMTLNFVLSH